ncbi:MAG: Hpt domain-containing protein [Pacificimonas sp.]
MTVDLETFERLRETMGPRLISIIGYFAEDGQAAVNKIESSQRAGDAAEMVMPAHTLKTEAWQLGAKPLGDLTETIEQKARRCVEYGDPPDDLLTDVAQLGPLFRETLSIFKNETDPRMKHREPKRFGRAFS